MQGVLNSLNGATITDASVLDGLNLKQAQLLLTTKGLSAEKQKELLVNAGLMASEDKVTLTLMKQALMSSSLGDEEKERALIKLGLIDRNTKEAISEAVCTKKDIEALVAQGLLNEEQKEGILAILGLDTANKSVSVSLGLFTKGIWANIKAMAAWMISNPLGWIILLGGTIAATVGLVDLFTTSVEEHREKLESLKSEYSDVKSELDGLKGELDGTQSRINELESKGKLTFTEAEELNNLRKQNNELQRSIDLLELQNKTKKKELNNQFVETMNSDIEQELYTRNENGEVVQYMPMSGQTATDDNEADYITQRFKDLERLRDELSSASTEAEKERIQRQIDDIEEYFLQKSADFTETAEGIDYIQNPTTEDDKKVNEWLDYINDFQDKMAIAMGGDNAKENAFNRLVDNWKFDEALNPLQKMGKEGKVTLEELKKRMDDPVFVEFVNKLKDIGFISDTTDGSLRFLASAFNGTTTSAKAYLDTLDDNESLSNFINNLDDEAKALGTTKDELSKLTAGHIILNNTKLSLDDKINQIKQLGIMAGWAEDKVEELVLLMNRAAGNLPDSMTQAEKDARSGSAQLALYNFFGGWKQVDTDVDDNTPPYSPTDDDKGKDKPDYEDPTDAIINRINLRSKELEQQEESIEDAIELFELGGDVDSFILDELNKLGDGGSVNLSLRPQIDTEELNKKGWDAGEGFATVFSSAISNTDFDDLIPENVEDTVAINFTPIIVDPVTGEFKGVLSEDELYSYAHDVLAGVREDDLNLQIGAKFEGEDAIDKAVSAGERIHNLHEGLLAENDYEKQISLTNDKLNVQKQRVDALKTANDELHQMAEDLRNSTPDWDEESWFDSQGEATEAYLNLYNNSTKEQQEALSDQFDKLSKLKKAWYENDEDRLALEKDILDTEKEILDLREENFNKATDFHSSYFDSRISILEAQYKLENSIAEARHELNKELETSKTMYEYLDEETRELLFNQEDYNELAEELLSIEKRGARLQRQYERDLENATLETVEEITANYERQYETLMKSYEIAKADLEIAKKKQQLNNVLNERKVRMFLNGQWQWVADTEEVARAKSELADAEYAKRVAKAGLKQQESINNLTLQQDQLGIVVKKFENGVITLDEAIIDAAGAIDKLPKALQEMYQNASKGNTSSSSNPFGTGNSSPSGASGGSTYTSNPSKEYVSWAKAQMAENSKNWHTADANGKKALEAANQTLGAEIGSTYDEASGTWKHQYATGSKYTKDGLSLLGEAGSEVYITSNGRLIPINQPTIGNIPSGGVVFNQDQMRGLRTLWDMSNLNLNPDRAHIERQPQQIDQSHDNRIIINGMTVDSGSSDGQALISALRRYVSNH